MIDILSGTETHELTGATRDLVEAMTGYPTDEVIIAAMGVIVCAVAHRYDTVPERKADLSSIYSAMKKALAQYPPHIAAGIQAH